jgi:spermidine synthase
VRASIVPPGPIRTLAACGLMIASGFAGLAYQIVWTQQSTLWLGQESAAVLAIVAAFFGGLAAGALTLGRLIERSAKPARWYAGCEIAIALWGLALVLLLPRVADSLLGLMGPQPSPLRHWSVAFGGTLLVLLPATMAMGATLPAMERVLAATVRNGTTIGTLYAANTLGAVLGVLATAFWLVPHFGLMRATTLCAMLNLICAIGVFALHAPASGNARSKTRPATPVLWTLAATGLLGIGYEVLAVRALSQVAENTVYTFAILLAVYLVGTALGAGVYARWLVAHRENDALPGHLLRWLAGACLGGMLLLAVADSIKAHVLGLLGMGMGAALAAEAAVATAAFLLPALLMGALFSHLSTRAQATGTTFGLALGINTLGAALAPLTFSVLLVPWLGLKAALLLIAAGYLLLASPSGWRTPSQWGIAAATVVCALWAPDVQHVTIPDGGTVVSHADGIGSSVSIVRDANGTLTLHIDNRQQEGSSATLYADTRQALLPLLLHPHPRDALFFGYGTGLTATSATLDPALQIDAVELVPEVVAASAHFAHAVAEGADLSRLHVMTADARRYARTTARTYDVIVADNFHPARSGAGTLYTVEHFALMRSRLRADGLICQWLPLHQLDLKTLRSIVRSFVHVQPNAVAVLATGSLDTPVIGLIARRDDSGFDPAAIRARLAQAGGSIELQRFALPDEFALLGSVIAGPRALADFSRDAPLNTDDLPVVTYSAPRITYAPDSSPRDRLLALLHEFSIEPSELLAHADEPWRARLGNYWRARDRFLEAGRYVRPTADVRQMLAQVREPLLDVLRISPDFKPAYEPLLQMAAALQHADPAAAQALIAEIEGLRRQPLAGISYSSPIP